MIPINKPGLDAEEKTEIMQVLEDNVLTSAARDSGKGVQDFETELCKFLKVKHVVAVIPEHLHYTPALIATDIKKGDEILVQSFTFVASTNFILAMGAKPIFVDINLNPVIQYVIHQSFCYCYLVTTIELVENIYLMPRADD
jgi:perosamine synthetase